LLRLLLVPLVAVADTRRGPQLQQGEVVALGLRVEQRVRALRQEVVVLEAAADAALGDARFAFVVLLGRVVPERAQREPVLFAAQNGVARRVGARAFGVAGREGRACGQHRPRDA